MKLKKRILSLALTLCILTSLMPAATLTADAAGAVWDGTTVDTNWYNSTGTSFTINTAAELAGLASLVNNANDFSGKTVTLGADIFLNNTTDAASWSSSTEGLHSWTPIGTSSNKFNGTFDGGGNTVSGVYISETTDYQGLFGYIGSSGTVQNVGVKDSYIYGGDYVGGIAGSNAGTVTSCYNTGNVGNASDSGKTAGGIVGLIAPNGIVTYCYNTGSVSGGSGGNTGGIIGFSRQGTVQYCCNTGSVSGTGYYVGGVVGINNYYDQVRSCCNMGSVSGTGYYVGGVIGCNFSSAVTEDCYNTGDVSGTSNSVGGVTGFNSSATIRYCYNAGSVSGTASVGGVAGDNADGTVTGCYYDSDKCSAGGINGGDTQNWAEGKTTDEMQTATAYLAGTDWASTAIWTFSSGVYPQLVGLPEENEEDAAYTVSGTVSLDASGMSGITVNLYASNDTGYETVLNSGVTDDSGNYRIDDVEDGLYYAVVAAENGSYKQGVSAEITVNGSDVTSADITLEAAPPLYYVITRGETATTYYYVYVKTGESSFAAFQTNADVEGNSAYASIESAVSEITKAVGHNSATLQFGLTGTGTNVTGTLSLSSMVDLTGGGTYTLLGLLESSAGHTVCADGANLIIGSGVTITNTNTSAGGNSPVYATGDGSVTITDGAAVTANSSAGCAIFNDGSGDITISGGTVSASAGNTVWNNSSGDISISGGTVSCSGGSLCFPVNNEGSGTVTVSGDAKVKSTNTCAIHNNGGNVEINGGDVSSDGSDAVNNVDGNITVSDGEITSTYADGSAIYNIDNSCLISITGGTLTAGTNGSAINNYYSATIKVSGGTLVGGTVSGYGLDKEGSGVLYLSGSPVISGKSADICTVTSAAIVANNGESTPASYTGGDLSIRYNETIDDGNTVAVSGVTDSNYAKFSLTNYGYMLIRSGSDLIISTPVEVWDGVTIANSFGGGTGTQDNPYIISNASQLAYLAQNVNSSTSYSGTYFKQTKDICLGSWRDDGDGIVENGEIYNSATGGTAYSASNWTSIGNSSNPFSGTYNGNGKSVSGLFIRSSSNYQGLFGYVGSGGTIKNLGVTDGYVSGGSHIGGVVGWLDGTIMGCYNTGSVCGTGFSVGGVAGDSSVSMTDCYNTGKISANGDMSYNVGGVVGSNGLNAVMKNCYNTGSITSSRGTAGGVAGYTFGPMQYCYNTGSVSSGHTYTGGVTGYISNYGTVQYCYNTGSVSGSRSYAGGITGSVMSLNQTITNAVQNCYNTGSVSGSSDHVGGIVGYADSARITISYCYNAGSVSGGSYVGSVVGYSYGTVTGCYYDKQMSTTGGINGLDAPGSADGKLTSELTVGSATESAFTGWSATTWTFSEDLYPRLTGYVNAETDYNMDITDAAYVSVSPVNLAYTSNMVFETASAVISDFTASTANSVSWTSGNAGIISISDGSAKTKGYGSVTLTASKGEVSKAVPLTAKVTYDVFFTSNGGSDVSSLQDVHAGSTITKPDDPTKDGYLLDGWYKEEACSNKWDFTTDTVTRDITLFAKWIKVYSVGGTVTTGANVSASVSEITVTLYQSDAETDYTATTDSNGDYSMTSVPLGTYTAVIQEVSGSYKTSSSASFTVSDGNITHADITLAADVVNTEPEFTKGQTASLSVAKNALATSILDLLPVTDPDSEQTLTWSVVSGKEPSHGTLTVTNATASSGGTEIAPGGTITYTPAADYVGTDSFKVQVTDGDDGEDSIDIYVNIGFWDSRAATGYAGGEGTVESPYQIATAAQLAYLALQVNAGNGYTDTYFKLTSNINLDSARWTPIGDINHTFNGIFDGGGHVVQNLTMGSTIEGEDDYMVKGLFGGLAGTVQNLGVEDFALYSVIPDIAGGIAGILFGGKILNCYATGNIVSIDSMFEGGLVGDNFTGYIYNSYSTVNIQNTEATGTDGSIGGITGYDNGGFTMNCWAAGNLMGDIENSVGALIGGAVSSTLTDCYWSSSATLTVGGTPTPAAVGAFEDMVGNDTTAMTSDDMKLDAFVTTLNANAAAPASVGFCSWKLVSGKNNGYPMLDVPGSDAFTYTIAPVSDQTFSNLTRAYSSGAQETKTITITRTGTGDLTNLSVALSGANASSFTITPPLTTTLNAATASATFTIKANDGLSAGTYTATVTVSADHMTSVAFSVTQVVNSTSGGSSYSLSSSSGSGAPLIINGESVTAGTANTATNSAGQSVTTVTVDTDRLEAILNNQGTGATVTIPVASGSDVASGVLTGETVKTMEAKAATLKLQTNSATYTVPASEINIDAVSQLLGSNISLSDITVNVSIAEPTNATAKVVADTANEGGFTVEVPAVEFTINCTYNGKTVSVSRFNSYVERMIAIPNGVDPQKITTGVVVRPDATTYHVPTQVIQIDGVYYAKINSLTNSTYAVVWHPVEFSDVTNHWAKDAINDMGSRMVVAGDESGNYNPDQDITRAEFAAILVRALGLAPGTGESRFSDVDSAAWYCGYVETAASYGIIMGYHETTFGPNDRITREQAMAMIARAMKITGLSATLTESEISGLLEAYSDGASASDYAKDSIAACLKTGIVSGTGNNTMAPKSCVTRADVAVMVERLLQKSELI